MMSIMDIYEKVSDEHEELWDRIEALDNFRSGNQPENVSDYQWSLLKKQLKAMRKYNKILARRCEDLYEQCVDNGLFDEDEHTITEKGLDAIATLIKSMSSAGQPRGMDNLESDYILTPGQSESPHEDYDLKTALVQSDDTFMKEVDLNNTTHTDNNNKNFSANTH